MITQTKIKNQLFSMFKKMIKKNDIEKVTIVNEEKLKEVLFATWLSNTWSGFSYSDIEYQLDADFCEEGKDEWTREKLIIVEEVKV